MQLLNNMISTDADEGGDKWIFYHLPIKCRGNFVRLVLEECGVEYIDAFGYKFLDGILRTPVLQRDKEKVKYLKQMAPNNEEVISKGLIPSEKNIKNLKRLYFPYGSPFLVNFDNPSVCLSQAPVIVQYLSNRYGLRPKSDIDHSRAGMIVANCNDFFGMIRVKSMNSKDMKSDKQFAEEIMDFFNTECQIWLDILSKPLEDRLYYFDDRITQCDLAVYNIMDCFYEIFGDNEKLMERFVWNPYPNLKRHYRNIIKVSKSIEPLMKRQKKMKVTWWPLEFDIFGILKMRKFFLKYANSKL